MLTESEQPVLPPRTYSYDIDSAGNRELIVLYPSRPNSTWLVLGIRAKDLRLLNLEEASFSRGLAVGDIDGDGDEDVLTFGRDLSWEENRLLGTQMMMVMYRLPTSFFCQLTSESIQTVFGATVISTPMAQLISQILSYYRRTSVAAESSRSLWL